jgi:hypothetical protein
VCAGLVKTQLSPYALCCCESNYMETKNYMRCVLYKLAF